MTLYKGNGWAQNSGAGERQSLSQLLFRIWPYWPLFLLLLALGVLGSWIYLRYATPYYRAHAQIVVNDNSQGKDNNLNVTENHLSQEAQTTETEKQVEIIQSKALLYDVVRKMNLYVDWRTENRLGTKPLTSGIPLGVALSDPEKIETEQTGRVIVYPEERMIEYAGQKYPVDSTVSTAMGSLRWHVYDWTAASAQHLELSIYPLSDAVARLQDRLLATPLGKQSPILDMTLTDEDPQRGERILEEIIRRYGERNMLQKKQQLDSTLEFIDHRLELVAGDLKGVESSLQSYKSNQGITNLASEGQNFLERVKDNDNKINEINIQLNVLDQIENYLDRSNELGGAPPATLGLTDQILVSLLTQLFQDEYDLDKLKQLSGARNPKVKILEDKIAQERNSIRQSVTNLKHSLQASKSALSSISNDYYSTLRAIPEKERVLVDISRDQSIKNDLYSFLLRKREETAIAAAAIVPNFNIIEHAESVGLVKPKRVLVYLYGIMLALLVSGLWVFIREFNSRKILYRNEVDSAGKIPVIGEIVYDRTAKKEPLVVGADSRTLISEQFRELRINISHKLHQYSGGRMVLVTSSVPGEGKSFLSVNLAVSFARASRKTALVEFDLYKPRLFEYLRLQPETGITDYLMEKADAEAICRKHSDIENLWLISTGTRLDNPAELLMNGRLPALMDFLRKNFDYVIIDTPCIGLVSDTKILGTYAQLCLYVLRHRYTQKGFLPYAANVQKEGHLPNLHFVLNGIRIRRTPGFDYWDSYGYNGYRYMKKNPYNYYGKPSRKWKQYYSRNN